MTTNFAQYKPTTSQKQQKSKSSTAFQLILEIFTKRATTTEAQLQIQLAIVRNELKHAREKVRLSKGSEQPGFMGLGAYEADVYRDAIKRQVQTILKKLERVREKRVLQRERRTELGFLTISLAGYTNAGKSSLFNALTEDTVEGGQRIIHDTFNNDAYGRVFKPQIPHNRHRRLHRPFTYFTHRSVPFNT